METPPVLEPIPDSPVEKAPVIIRTPAYRQLAVILAIIAIGLIAVQWYFARQQDQVLREEIARRLATLDTQSKESRTIAAQGAEATREAQIKLGLLEGKLQESQNQQIALEALYQELSRSRDESILADVEQTLLVANQQLQVAGNVKSALIALYDVDARLARLDRPQLAPLRKVIARDTERLKLAPYVDTVGISAQLDNLITALDQLPLMMDGRPVTQAPVATAAPADSSAWGRLTRELWQEFRNLVRIQNTNQQDVALLAPTQTYFLRENLKLRLLGARVALLGRDEKSFKADLNAARDWLTRYFDTRDKSVSGVLTTISKLSDSEITIELPDVTASLEAVRNYRLTRERVR